MDGLTQTGVSFNIVLWLERMKFIYHPPKLALERERLLAMSGGLAVTKQDLTEWL